MSATLTQYIWCGEWLVPYNQHCVNCGRVHVVTSDGDSVTRFPFPKEVRFKENDILINSLSYNLAMWERSNVKQKS
jgi:hypothetical protein